MTFRLWEQIDPSTPLRDLLETSVLFHDTDPQHGVVATFRDAEHGDVVMQFARTPDLDLSGILTFRDEDSIAAVAFRFFARRDAQMVAIPPVTWRHRRAGVRWRTPIVAAAAGITFIALLAINTAWAAAVAIPVAAVVGAMLWCVLRRVEPTSIPTPGSLVLDGDNVVEYAQQRRVGQRPEMLRHAERHSRITDRVVAIQEDFGELRSDIIYRIDHSALFDSAVPSTARFQVALITWDNAGDVPLDELDSLAADVEITYSVARKNAESMGLTHLPEGARSDGRRAAKAARLAISSTSAGEPGASRHQLIRILNSLALYYLPDVKDAARAIEPRSGHSACPDCVRDVDDR